MGAAEGAGAWWGASGGVGRKSVVSQGLGRWGGGSSGERVTQGTRNIWGDAFIFLIMVMVSRAVQGQNLSDFTP